MGEVDNNDNNNSSGSSNNNNYKIVIMMPLYFEHENTHQLTLGKLF